jgi:hypothetical protein
MVLQALIVRDCLGNQAIQRTLAEHGYITPRPKRPILGFASVGF